MSASNSKEKMKPLCFQDVQQHFEKPLSEAAAMLGRSSSKLKQELRGLGIPRWPYRKINALKERLRVLELKHQQHEQKGNEEKGSESSPFKVQMEEIEKQIEQIRHEPRVIVQEKTKPKKKKKKVDTKKKTKRKRKTSSSSESEEEEEEDVEDDPGEDDAEDANNNSSNRKKQKFDNTSESAVTGGLSPPNTSGTDMKTSHPVKSANISDVHPQTLQLRNPTSSSNEPSSYYPYYGHQQHPQHPQHPLYQQQYRQDVESTAFTHTKLSPPSPTASSSTLLQFQHSQQQQAHRSYQQFDMKPPASSLPSFGSSHLPPQIPPPSSSQGSFHSAFHFYPQSSMRQYPDSKPPLDNYQAHYQSQQAPIRDTNSITTSIPPIYRQIQQIPQHYMNPSSPRTTAPPQQFQSNGTSNESMAYFGLSNNTSQAGNGPLPSISSLYPLEESAGRLGQRHLSQNWNSSLAIPNNKSVPLPNSVGREESTDEAHSSNK